MTKIGTTRLVIGGVLLLAVAGGVTALVISRQGAPIGEREGGPGTATTEQALDELTVGAPTMDFSVSPMGELGLSGFDLGNDVAGDLFGNVGVNSDFSYTGSLTPASPTVQLTAPTDYNVAAPAQEQPPEEEQSASQANAANCAQFSSVPSCSYVTDPNGRTLCEACKAAGY